MTLPDPFRLAALTTGRQDFGILRSTLLALARDTRFDLRLWVGGMHLNDRYGRTVEMVEQEELEIASRLDFLTGHQDVVAQTAAAMEQVGVALGEERPDALLLVGDRTETWAAAAAATLRKVPVAHLHGGEETEGAIDNACRHAITKLAHLHLVSHPEHARRVIQMGEQPKNVKVVGAPGLDNLYREDLPSRSELEDRLGLPLKSPVVLVTMHPTTLAADILAEARAVAEAAERVDATYVVTGPNADPGGEEIREFFVAWGRALPRVAVVEALGERDYWGMLKLAAAVVGNSSSGILEAPAADVQVVNVGARQQGRRRYGAVADVHPEAARVETALRAALEGRLPNRGERYMKGPAAPRVVEALRRWEVPDPPRKLFYDLSVEFS